MRSPNAAVLAWSEQTPRAEDLAAALGIASRRFGGLGLRGIKTAPLRWALNTVRTAAWLARHRPLVVVVQNPPVVLGFIAFVHARLVGGWFLLDSHPASFGRKNAHPLVSVLPAHRWLARRAAGVLVTTEELAEEVRHWGGHPLVVHESPPAIAVDTGPVQSLEPADEVLYVGTFAKDEPVGVVVEAARLLPQVCIDITGDVERAPAGILDDAPDSARFVGFLGPADYAAAVGAADVVLVLTDEPTSVPRSAYEAVYAGRPLVVSDWPVLRELFPYAIHVPNEPAAVAAGLRTAFDRHHELLSVSTQARIDQERRWDAQLSALRDRIEQGAAAA